ncbi:hypothetical protein HK405_001609, partial [Cladochytrium tenue]
MSRDVSRAASAVAAAEFRLATPWSKTGKRKAARKVVKKMRPKLDKSFSCLFCNHEQSIYTT